MADQDDHDDRPSQAERSRLNAFELYEVVSRDGESELERPATSLWWSGIAAGIAITASLVSEGLLYLHLPEGPWHHALSSFGYTVGFLIVVIGRLQLFTENTITPVLPLLSHPGMELARGTAILWAVVFAANMLGALLAIAVMVFGGTVTPEQLEAMTAASRVVLGHGWLETFRLAIPAGFLIAAAVWLLPNARGYEIWVVVGLTYVIALGDYSHVVAGAAEVFLLWMEGEADVAKVLGFISAAFLGNVLGGTGLFALLAYGQVKQEL